MIDGASVPAMLRATVKRELSVKLDNPSLSLLDSVMSRLGSVTLKVQRGLQSPSDSPMARARHAVIGSRVALDVGDSLLQMAQLS